MPDLHFEKILLRVLRYVVREEIDEAGVKGEFALVDEEPDGFPLPYVVGIAGIGTVDEDLKLLVGETA